MTQNWVERPHQPGVSFLGQHTNATMWVTFNDRDLFSYRSVVQSLYQGVCCPCSLPRLQQGCSQFFLPLLASLRSPLICPQHHPSNFPASLSLGSAFLVFVRTLIIGLDLPTPLLSLHLFVFETGSLYVVLAVMGLLQIPGSFCHKQPVPGRDCA